MVAGAGGWPKRVAKTLSRGHDSRHPDKSVTCNILASNSLCELERGRIHHLVRVTKKLLRHLSNRPDRRHERAAMEAYPKDYIEHNLPLIVLSGLPSQSDPSKEAPEQSRNPLLEGGFRIRTDTAPLTGSAAESLLRAFLAGDSSDAPWNNRPTPVKGDNGGTFRIKSVGRVGQTPSDALPAAFFQLFLLQHFLFTELTDSSSPMPFRHEKHHLLHIPPDWLRLVMAQAHHHL